MQDARKAKFFMEQSVLLWSSTVIKNEPDDADCVFSTNTCVLTQTALQFVQNMQDARKAKFFMEQSVLLWSSTVIKNEPDDADCVFSTNCQVVKGYKR